MRRRRHRWRRKRRNKTARAFVCCHTEVNSQIIYFRLLCGGCCYIIILVNVLSSPSSQYGTVLLLYDDHLAEQVPCKCQVGGSRRGGSWQNWSRAAAAVWIIELLHIIYYIISLTRVLLLLLRSRQLYSRGVAVLLRGAAGGCGGGRHIQIDVSAII